MNAEVDQTKPVTPVYYTRKFRHVVDSKRRVQVPADWRGKGEAKFALIFVPGSAPQESCLVALPPAEWEKLVAKLESMAFFNDPRADSLRRLIGSHSDHVTVDSSGRISLDEELAKVAGLEKEALFVGMVHRFQIWNPERYAHVSAKDTALTQDAFSLM